MTETTHLKFLSTNENVCEHPDKLGRDVILTDTDPATCPACVGMLVAYNRIENIYERGQIHGMYFVTPEPSFERGALILGMLLGSMLWVLVFAVLILLTR